MMAMAILEGRTIHINPTFTMLPFSGVQTTILRDPRLVMKATPAEFVLPKNAVATRRFIKARRKELVNTPGH